MVSDPKLARTLYKKLLALYPHAFREQLGESMEQTFNDLCNEWKQQPTSGWFGFVLGLFVDTALGIVQEYISLIKEMNPMKNSLTGLRLPAVIGFLLILPFMLLEFIFVIVKRLDFDLRDALDSSVTFGFLWLGTTASLLILIPLVRHIRAGKEIRAYPIPAQGNTALANPTSAAIIGFLLALPFATILSLLVLGREPPFAHLLYSPDPDQPNVLGTLIFLGALVLTVLAGLIARAPIMRTIQAGGSLFTHPVNLALAVVSLTLILAFVGGVVIDQYPCWIGVPNCD